MSTSKGLVRVPYRVDSEFKTVSSPATLGPLQRAHQAPLIICLEASPSDLAMQQLVHDRERMVTSDTFLLWK